jgi:hypothetical protein
VSFKGQLRALFPPFIGFAKLVDGVREIFNSTEIASLAPGETTRKVA